MSTESTETLIPDVSPTERHGYLFGHPIAHSMSPLLHKTVYDGLGLKWAQYPLESKDMSLFLQLIKHPQFYGKKPTSQTNNIQPQNPNLLQQAHP